MLCQANFINGIDTKTLYSVLCCHLNGKGTLERVTYVYVQLTHFAEQQKSTQH